MHSIADADAYRGLTEALAGIPCGRPDLITSKLPVDYAANLQAAVNRHDQLVIAGSFLLGDAVDQVARANPATHFLLVDPILTPRPLPNLLVLAVRRDQSALLAGALAAMLTKSGVVAGVYGPGDADDQVERAGFERGAATVRPGIRVLGAYQPGSGDPYNDPAWGAAQARSFASQGADVVFATGADTGLGALRGAAAAGRPCIADELPASIPRPSCLVATTTVSLDRAVNLLIEQLQAGWHSGVTSFGLDQSVVGLDPLGVDPAIEERLQNIGQQLAQGQLH